ncbi:hypothetical protein SAMN05216359_101655 [Roseateles sp. YR242]|uniref:hypothetical protein n=1 Tax=Roseateles sp. YR242 TaxID=1855305 RepID=UPI0008ACE065|nr:hypothetical protein [Roseateles sp. YR242]SEK38817.1 hypothetical protein SAMN05216359_101655 [Roseateles sp. YR242]
MPAAIARPWGTSSKTRTAGLIVVALVHVAMVAALVEGFRRHAAPTPPPITQVSIEQAPPETPKRDLPAPAETPQFPAVKPFLVAIPEEPVIMPSSPPGITPASNIATEASSTAEPLGPSTSSGAAGKGAVQPALSEPVSPGMVCTAMGVPEMPSVSWTGEATFHVVADVRAGRVVSTEIRALQGSMDARTRRAFSNAIDTVLKQRYVCPGDHRFQQDFAFRVD